MVKDIVCGMDIETVSAAGIHQHDDEFQLSFGHHECTSVKGVLSSETRLMI